MVQTVRNEPRKAKVEETFQEGDILGDLQMYTPKRVGVLNKVSRGFKSRAPTIPVQKALSYKATVKLRLLSTPEYAITTIRNNSYSASS